MHKDLSYRSWEDGEKESPSVTEMYRKNGPSLEWWTGYRIWNIRKNTHRPLRIDGPFNEYPSGDRANYK